MSLLNLFRQSRVTMPALPAGPSNSFSEAEAISKRNFLNYITNLENQVSKAERQVEILSEQLREANELLGRYKKNLQILPRNEQKRVLLTLIPFFDSLDYARSLSAGKSDQWSQGLHMLQQSRAQQLKQLNVVTFGQDGDPFYPQWHEALDKEMGVAQQDIIAYVYACGYRFENDGQPIRSTDIIRPAQVKVAVARYTATG